MKKFAIVFGIAFAILVGFTGINVIANNAIDDPVMQEVVDVQECMDNAVDYANSELGFSGKVASAKIIGVVKDPNYAGDRVDVQFFNVTGDLIGSSSISGRTLGWGK